MKAWIVAALKRLVRWRVGERLGQVEHEVNLSEALTVDLDDWSEQLVLFGEYPLSFESLVNHHLAQGWQVAGGPYVAYGHEATEPSRTLSVVLGKRK